MLTTNNHIAVIRLSAMGDVAITVPVLKALTEQHPNLKITVVSRPFFKPFFTQLNNIAFFEVDLSNRHKGFVGLIRLFLDLKKLKINTVADLHNVLRSKIIRTLFLFSGSKTAATNKGRAAKTALTRAENKNFEPVKTMFQNHVETFNKLGYALELSNPSFLEKEVLTSELIKLIGENHSKLIGIAPFAKYDSKAYPLDLMQEVIDILALNSNYKILLFGGGTKETELLNKLQNNHSNVINVAGKIKLQEELKLISNLNVMLSMDSGNSHVAAMLGVKVVTLWGATHPFAGFSPFNQPLENCLVSDREKFPMLPTSIYGNKKVVGYEDVMRTISVEKIVFSVQSQLAD